MRRTASSLNTVRPVRDRPEQDRHGPVMAHGQRGRAVASMGVLALGLRVLGPTLGYGCRPTPLLGYGCWALLGHGAMGQDPAWAIRCQPGALPWERATPGWVARQGLGKGRLHVPWP